MRNAEWNTGEDFEQGSAFVRLRRDKKGGILTAKYANADHRPTTHKSSFVIRHCGSEWLGIEQVGTSSTELME